MSTNQPITPLTYVYMGITLVYQNLRGIPSSISVKFPIKQDNHPNVVMRSEAQCL